MEIYSKLLVFLGKNFPNKNVARDEIVLANKRGNFSRLLLEYLLNFVSFFKHDKEVVFFQNSYLSLGKLFYFSLVSRYRVKVKFSEHKYHKKRGVLSTLQRQELTDYLPDNGDFENFLKLWLPFDLPMCYVENYDYICRLSRMVYPKTAPNIIYSANAWYYDEVFKVWAAEHSAESILVGVQHGGNYGVVRHLFEEEFERRITDYYCTWGWEGKKSDSVISICSGKMWDYKEVKKIKSDEILFSMTIKPKFFSDIRRIPEESEGYLRSHKAFLDVVSLEVVSSIRIRPYQSLESFRIENLWKKYNNSILVEGWNVRFVDSLANCKLFICDHIMTTYLEALKMNVPTLVYFDVNYPSGMLREEAMKDFQKLERVGIVHSSIEELARAVNIIYKDIDTWWCNSELQTVRKEFCNKYANTSNCSVKNLDDMFAKMSKTY